MIDYAHVESIENEKIKTSVKVKSISIGIISLSLTIMLVLLVYIIGYQNMSIARSRHYINEQRIILKSLIIEKQALLKNEQQYLSPNRIIKSQKFDPANYSQIKVTN